ncbi:hypothetical protein AGMMS4952_18790 [Spirochaetia bacterium]|nr:hypothetical protein AGMMS4952_18790 [Spirochaetia bacterium]
MALLQKKLFSEIAKERNQIHEYTEASYTVFSKDGQTIFQLDTFGTSHRKVPGKISQSLQIDKEMAEVLVQKLRFAFNID